MKTRGLFWPFLLAALQLTGCSQPTTTDRGFLQPAFNPEKFHGDDVYEILPQTSEIRILVYRGGPLAGLGHNHVINTRDIRGKIYRHQELRHSGFVLQLPVHGFEVDNPALRVAAGPAFAVMPSAKDIAGTRLNMLGEQVLNGKQHPTIHLISVALSGNKSSLNALTRVTVRDISTDINIPVKVGFEDSDIIIKGQTGISQTELGMKPFSILMGAIAIQDKIIVQFDLVARRADH